MKLRAVMEWRKYMNSCNFDTLLKLVDKQLDLDGKLDIYDHLDHCENCRDAVYHILRDRDEGFFVPRPHKMEPAGVR
jgi:hypothetical protein